MESAILSSRDRVDLPAWGWQILLFTALYVVIGYLGLELTHYRFSSKSAMVVWPPAGLSLAALILFGLRLWPGVLIGSLLLALTSHLSWPPLVGIAIGDTLEALVGATLLVRVVDFRPTLERQRDVVALLLIGVLGCATIPATFGTISVLLAGAIEASEVGLVWLLWWLGTLGGVLIVTPVALMLVHGTPSWISLARRLESWVVLVSLLATGLFAFLGPTRGLLVFVTTSAPAPFLIWAAIRLGPRGGTLASSIMILIATVALGLGSGPFALGTRTEGMLLLWSYSVFIGIMILTLSTVVEQRNVSDQRYRSEEADRLRTEKQKLLLLERERLTREIHDGLGGQLVSALSMVERGLAPPDEVAEALRRAIDDISIVIDSLDPDTTDPPTSLGKLRARLEPMLRRNGIALAWSLEDIPGLDEFSSEAALHLLRIIQEAVTNTLRHANADNVEVRITSSGDVRTQLHVSIRDDGLGLPATMHSDGRGIKNMKSRAEKLGAVLRIEGTSSGTQIDLKVPLSLR